MNKVFSDKAWKEYILANAGQKDLETDQFTDSRY
jgi:hypothetical protein